MSIFSQIKNYFSKEAAEDDTGSGTSIITPRLSNYSSFQAKQLISKNKYWVYASSNKNASTVSSVLLRLYSITDSISGQKKPIVPYRDITNKELKKLAAQTNLKANPLLDSTLSIEQIFRHPALDLLNKTNIRHILYFIQIYLELTGNAYLFVMNNRFGIPEDIQIIPSQCIKPKVIDGEVRYILRNGPEEIVLSCKEIIHFKNPNPENPVIGLSPLASVVQSEDLYQSMISYEFALNNNSAIPAMIVKYISGELKREDKIKVEAEWNKALRGISKTGKIKVTDENFNIEKIGLDPKEMQYLKGKKWVREEIAAAFGVPLALLTTDNVNKANADAAIEIYKQFSIIPRIQLLEQTLNAELISRYASADRLFVAFDPIMSEDKEFKLKEITELFEANIIDRDEARMIYGLEIQ